jgi:MFS family permease
VGSLVSLTLVDRFSRKTLYALTTLGNIIGLITMGIYNYCKIHNAALAENFKFVPVASLSLVIFIAASGRLPLTFVMVAEIQPQNIRSFGISVANTCNWTLAFILLRYFSTAVEILKFYNCMFILSGFALFGLIFVVFCVPESKNRSFEEIENSLINKKSKYREAEKMENHELEVL